MFFIWLFLPVSLIAYYISVLAGKSHNSLKAANVVLLVLSLFFYAWGGIKVLILVLLLCVVNYVAGLLLERGKVGSRSGSYISPASDKRKTGSKRKIILAVAVFINILLLAFFKYGGMLFKSAGIIMPLALSFIVFQSVSYVVDVYRGQVKAEKNFAYFVLYILLFVQLLQGPIMRYGDLGSQINSRTHSPEKFVHGIKRFCYGLGKKIIVANTAALAADQIWGSEVSGLSTIMAWFGLLLYTIQIYFDFSGYTDMAIGVGEMFGFNISENFNYPYTSFSVQEFWRRWHITLSSWFKDYLYIPLGGNRKGNARTLLNLGIVFLATGIWHGADLTFILWGIWHGVFLIIERLFLGKLLKKNPIQPINWLYTITVVMLGWVLFRADNISYAWGYIKVLFGVVSGDTILRFINMNLLIAIVIGILFSGLLQRLLSRVYGKISGTVPVQVIDFALQMLIFIWSVMLIASGSYNPSIYGAF